MNKILNKHFRYDVCIRQADGFCCIEYTVKDSKQIVLIFSLHFMLQIFYRFAILPEMILPSIISEQRPLSGQIV